jgi:hypothetical protein
VPEGVLRSSGVLEGIFLSLRIWTLRISVRSCADEFSVDLVTGLARLDDAAVGEDFAVVVEHHDTVAEEAPSLIRVGAEDACPVSVGLIGGRAIR